MAKKSSPKEKVSKKANQNLKANFEGAGSVCYQNITQTLEVNFMPYAMSVIVSRAIPEIDGFKPSHRKLLYTMYKMNLLSGPKIKSANIVGQTMRLNPHGDAAIYETMVRMSRGNEALLHPFVDSKGSFGKFYSRDMAYAASRYTEAKLSPICEELFKDIDKDAVDFIENYDSTTTEPMLLPVKFPSILVNSTLGLAVGMATNICSFNLEEICETTIELIKNPEFDIFQTIKAPDFSGGGYIIYDKSVFENIFKTGRGSFKIRSKYTYDKDNNCIEITEIPPTTTVEAIIDKIVDLIKLGKIKEISDVRDETDLSGLKLTIDIKKSVEPEKLMMKLFKLTPLQDSFGCNFNILVAGTPRVMGIAEILNEWIAFRTECVKRRVFFDLNKKKEKLHLMIGLAKILLDIDKAVKIVRETEEESDVVPNLMIGFGIDKIQADYVAEIKLRHLNREYILKRTSETENLKNEIAQMEEILSSVKKVQKIIINELEEIIKKYSMQRKTMLMFIDNEDEMQEELEEIPDYPVNLFFTQEGYFKKITPQSFRMSSIHKLKENDHIILHLERNNNYDLLFFSDKGQVYKAKVNDFEDTKASVLGDYIPAKLGFDQGESVVFMVATKDYSGNLLFFFENGKCAKIPLSSYETKTNRKKLSGAYNTNSPLVKIEHICVENLPQINEKEEGQQVVIPQLDFDREFMLSSSQGKVLVVHSGMIALKTTRSSQGVNVLTLKKGAILKNVKVYIQGTLEKEHLHKTKNIPAAGKMPTFSGEQITLV